MAKLGIFIILLVFVVSFNVYAIYPSIFRFVPLPLDWLFAVVISGATESTIGYKVVSYAGGLVTGVLLLAILVLKREWFKQSLYRWFLGFYMATFGFWQICQGILEGAFHDMYIADATNIFSLSYCVGYAFGLCGMALYWVFMPGVRGLIAKEKHG